MASLRAESRSVLSRAKVIASRTLSLVLFLLLFSVGWVGLSYVRSVVSDRVHEAGPLNSKVTPVPISSSNSFHQANLVYSSSDDDRYYHTAAHSPAHAIRNALSEQVARERGLKPCPICIRPH